MKPYSPDAYHLLHQGAIALAEVECNGLRIDMPYLDKAMADTTKKIECLRKDIQNSPVMQTWKKIYRGKTNIDSGDQLGNILFNHLGHTPKDYTASGKPSTDEEALRKIDDPFVALFLERKKLTKALSTNLKGIYNEVVDGYLHPFFNLDPVSTYRSSSSNPNFQNIPIRNEEIGKLIRRAFIPRKGRCLAELDYGGIEVRIAACYHLDPAMISYICDTTKDMHRDMAMKCYKLTKEEVTKKIRYCGKNMFVFPQFYGDWYIDCARSLWEAIGKMSLVTETGTPLRKHLKKKGIIELGALDPTESPKPGSFEEHIQKVERWFWNEKFPVYTQWKKSWYSAYLDQGWFQTLTGFICQGTFKRNQVINFPVQGSAFHCLLWSLCKIIKELKKRKMKTLIVGQIHDSIVADVVEEELEDFLAMCHDIMTNQLRSAWSWIAVPLEVEADVCPVGGSWADKKPYTIKK